MNSLFDDEIFDTQEENTVVSDIVQKQEYKKWQKLISNYPKYIKSDINWQTISDKYHTLNSYNCNESSTDVSLNMDIMMSDNILIVILPIAFITTCPYKIQTININSNSEDNKIQDIRLFLYTRIISKDEEDNFIYEALTGNHISDLFEPKILYNNKSIPENIRLTIIFSGVIDSINTYNKFYEYCQERNINLILHYDTSIKTNKYDNEKGKMIINYMQYNSNINVNTVSFGKFPNDKIFIENKDDE